MNTFWYNCIYIYISKSRNPKISRKFLAVSTSSFDGVKFFVLHLIHSVMVNLRCYRATYRHGVIPPPRQDSVQSRHLFQRSDRERSGVGSGDEFSKAGFLVEKKKQLTCWMKFWMKMSVYIRVNIEIVSIYLIYIHWYTYKSSHVYPDLEPTWQKHDPQIAGCLDS